MALFDVKKANTCYLCWLKTLSIYSAQHKQTYAGALQGISPATSPLLRKRLRSRGFLHIPHRKIKDSSFTKPTSVCE